MPYDIAYKGEPGHKLVTDGKVVAVDQHMPLPPHSACPEHHDAPVDFFGCTVEGCRYKRTKRWGE